MSLILNFIYAIVLIIASPWIAWRRLTQGKNRRGWSQKLLGLVPKRVGHAKCVWMHAVSVGEVNLLAPVIAELTAADPHLDIWISTTTETGFDLASKKYANHRVFFCPADFSWAVRNTIARVRPTLLVLAELELWPNLIRLTRAAGVDVAVINGRMSPNSFRGYSRVRRILRPIFKRLSFVGAQTETYRDRFVSLGCEPGRVLTTGSVKFDGALKDRANSETQRLKQLAGLAGSERVFVAGSTQIEEDLIAAEVFSRCSEAFPDLRMVLVPRHPERCGQLARQLSAMGIAFTLRSEMKVGDLKLASAGGDSLARADEGGVVEGAGADSFAAVERVIVVDRIGELGAWWALADLAYVGGSMGSRGGQNMIEPCALGVPTCFGPRTENFRDVVQLLLESDAAQVIQDRDQLESVVRQVLAGGESSVSLVEMAERARQLVLGQQGASATTASEILALLEGKSLALSCGTKRAA